MWERQTEQGQLRVPGLCTFHTAPSGSCPGFRPVSWSHKPAGFTKKPCVEPERGSCEAAQQLGVQSSLSDSPARNWNFPLFLCNKESNPKGSGGNARRRRVLREPACCRCPAQTRFCADFDTASCTAFPLGRSGCAHEPFPEPEWVIRSLPGCPATPLPQGGTQEGCGTKLSQDGVTGH